MNNKYSKIFTEKVHCERCNNRLDISFNFNLADTDDINCYHLNSGRWVYNEDGTHKRDNVTQRMWTCDFCIKYIQLYKLHTEFKNDTNLDIYNKLIEERAEHEKSKIIYNKLNSKYLQLYEEHDELVTRDNILSDNDFVIHGVEVINI
jgi:hypothetical protein